MATITKPCHTIDTVGGACLLPNSLLAEVAGSLPSANNLTLTLEGARASRGVVAVPRALQVTIDIEDTYILAPVRLP